MFQFLFPKTFDIMPTPSPLWPTMVVKKSTLHKYLVVDILLSINESVVGWLVGRSVCYNFLGKVAKFNFHASIEALVFKNKCSEDGRCSAS